MSLSTPSSFHAWLSRHEWLSCPLTLENTFCTGVSVYSLRVLDALFRFAARAIPDKTWPLWFFRPSRLFSSSISQHGRYEVTLLFPNVPLSFASVVLAAVQTWLARPEAHFRLLEAGEARVDSLDKVLLRLEEQFPGMPFDAFCLQVMSPLPCDGRLDDLNAAWIGNQLLRRVERFFGPMPAAMRRAALDSWSDLRVVPWFLRREVHRQPSRSKKGTRFVDGFTGPLFVEGECSAAFPLLVFGSALNVGSRLGFGQGAYALSPEEPHLDARLFSEKLFNEAQGRCGRAPSLSLEQFRNCDWPDDEAFDRFANLLLFGLFNRALAKASEALGSKWEKGLPDIPADPMFYEKLAQCIPVKNTVCFRLLSRLGERHATGGTTGEGNIPTCGGSCRS